MFTLLLFQSMSEVRGAYWLLAVACLLLFFTLQHRKEAFLLILLMTFFIALAVE